MRKIKVFLTALVMLLFSGCGVGEFLNLVPEESIITVTIDGIKYQCKKHETNPDYLRCSHLNDDGEVVNSLVFNTKTQKKETE